MPSTDPSESVRFRWVIDLNREAVDQFGPSRTPPAGFSLFLNAAKAAFLAGTEPEPRLFVPLNDHFRHESPSSICRLLVVSCVSASIAVLAVVAMVRAVILVEPSSGGFASVRLSRQTNELADLLRWRLSPPHTYCICASLLSFNRWWGTILMNEPLTVCTLNP